MIKKAREQRLVIVAFALVLIVVFAAALAFYKLGIQHTGPPPIPGTVVLDAKGVLVYDSEWHPNLQAGASYNFSFVRTSGPGYWVKVGPDPTGNPAILPKTNITPDATSLALTFTIQASQSYWIELSNLGDEYNHTDYHVTVTVA